MVRIIESLTAINSVMRTLLAAGALAVMSIGGWFGYRSIQADALVIKEKNAELITLRGELEGLVSDLAERDATVSLQARQIVDLDHAVEQRDQQIQNLDTKLRLLTIDRRIARLTVLDQRVDPNDNKLHSVVQFLEVDPQGQALEAPREFDILGDMVFIHCWVVKFEDDLVGASDPLRSTSLVIFRSLFGQHQSPGDGFTLDVVGSRPSGYGADSQMSEFERGIWDNFWSVANDTARAGGLGIRAAHGEAPSIRVEPNRSYLLQLRASDGLSIIPEPRAPQPGQPPT
jgi:hypothetical protein